jgi:hypothetical protein
MNPEQKLLLIARAFLLVCTCLLFGCSYEHDMGCSEETPCFPPDENAPPALSGLLVIDNNSSQPEVGPRICAVTTQCSRIRSIQLDDYADAPYLDPEQFESCEGGSILLEGEWQLRIRFKDEIVGCEITVHELQEEGQVSDGWNAIVCTVSNIGTKCSREEFSTSSFPENGSTTFRLEL